MKLQTLKSLRFKPMVAAAAATLLVTGVAHADVESGKLVLAGFIDAAEGTELIAGNYADVITKLAPHAIEFNTDQVAASTNLCVAYVATGRLGEAHGACDEAIKIARLDQLEAPLAERLAYEHALSIAYANRAVLTKLSGK